MAVLTFEFAFMTPDHLRKAILSQITFGSALMATQIPPPVATSNSPTPLWRDGWLNPVFCYR